MAKCVKCGRKGLFLRLDSAGLCADCARQAQLERDAKMAQLAKAARPTAEPPRKPVTITIKPISVTVTSSVSTIGTISRSPTDVPPSTYLRSPLQKDRRGLFDVPGAPDLLDSPDEDILLVIFLMYYIGWPVAGVGGSAFDIRTFFPNPQATLNELYRREWIIHSDVRAVLERQTVGTLRGFADSHHVAVPKGKKAVIIDRIMAGVDADSLEAFRAEHDFIQPSSAGFHMLRSIYNERVKYECGIANAFMSGDMETAFSLHAEYFKRRPYLVGQPYEFFAPPSSFAGALDDVASRLRGINCTAQFIEYFEKHPTAARLNSDGFPNLEQIKLLL